MNILELYFYKKQNKGNIKDISILTLLKTNELFYFYDKNIFNLKLTIYLLFKIFSNLTYICLQE